MYIHKQAFMPADTVLYLLIKLVLKVFLHAVFEGLQHNDHRCECVRERARPPKCAALKSADSYVVVFLSSSFFTFHMFFGLLLFIHLLLIKWVKVDWSY